VTGRLEGKAAVVVGGSSGFGEAIARRFVQEGARVMIAARGEQNLCRAAAEIGAEAAVCDATDWQQLKALAGAALAKLGRLDVAVNSAGYADAVPIARLEPERVERMVAVQYTGALYFLQHMANAMVSAGNGGSVVTISSLTGTLVAEGHAPYAGAKAGVNHLTRIAASEYGAKGIRFNLVSPTTIETPMIAQLFATPGVREAMAAETALGALPEIEDVVNAVLFFASDESRFVTGQNLHVDAGGSLCRLPRQAEVVRSVEAALARAKLRASGS
jgi:NAD(P)-dependent dehydrogenase (short-subunit alcohol dehydrogenase family)